ncbi:SIF2 SIR4-interacting protein SIF2 [Candida maltosa Xu316]
MSLTSKELNYLIWRYLQESGYDLSAYALNQQSQCSEYEDNSTTQEIISKIKPGCLVNLVQRGILFTVAEMEATGDSELSLLGALMQDELTNFNDENSKNNNSKRFMLKSEITLNGNKNDNDNVSSSSTSLEFKAKSLIPQISFPSSLTCDWHPTSEVFAYGKDDGNAIINAIQDGKIIETRTLTHPNLLNVKNQINIVSWSPQGNLIITAGANSELRAWSPDGKLKNIANTITDESIELDNNKIKSIIASLTWSPNGKYLLSIDSKNQVSLWDGTTISLIKQIKNLEINDDSVVCSCWLGEDKFALTTNTNGIKIYDIIPPSHFGGQLDIQPIGMLNGHEHNITIMKLNPVTKLLASCSDFDYSIKVWSSSSSQECLDLNINPDKKYDLKVHAAPIIGLYWLSHPAESNILLSISMEGTLNIWDATTAENLKSSDIFGNEANFTEDMKSNVAKNVLVFNASLSPNGKYLALGDDYCRVSIWDISFDKREPKDQVKCVAIHKPELSEEDQQKVTVGICDLKWDHNSALVAASFNGIQSVIVSLSEEKENGEPTK